MKIRLNYLTETPSHWRHCRLIRNRRHFELRTYYTQQKFCAADLAALGLNPQTSTEKLGLIEAQRVGQTLDAAMALMVENVKRTAKQGSNNPQ